MEQNPKNPQQNDDGLFASLLSQRRELEERFITGKQKDLQNELISAAEDRLAVFKDFKSEIISKVDQVNTVLQDLHGLVRDKCAGNGHDEDFVKLLSLVPRVGLQ